MRRKGNRQERWRRQVILREKRGEKAYLFDKDLVGCIAEIERENWEFAIRANGGDVAHAAEECGIQQVPSSAKVLWGVSAQSALETYKRWQRRIK
jgi:hypothetical protein